MTEACDGVCDCNNKRIKLDNEKKDTDLDDIWGDDDYVEHNTREDEQYGVVPEGAEHVDISSLRRIHAKQGYVEGLSQAKENSLQDGFNVGYPLGGEFGIAIGEIMSKVVFNGDSTLFETARKELSIANILNKKYFDENLECVGEHPVIKKWQNVVGL